MPAISIFFSHSSRDRQWCEWLAAEAPRAGVNVYLAEHDPQPGSPLAEKVKQRIRECHAFVVLLTHNTANSSYVHQEIGFALSQRKLVIPVVQRGIDPTQLAMLHGMEYIDFDFENPAAGKASLAAELKRLAERQRKQQDIETLIAVAICLALIVMVLSDGGGATA